MRLRAVLVVVVLGLGVDGLVPFASMEALKPWLSEASFGAVEPSRGTLRPRLEALDDDPLTLGVMEATDVAAVAALIADSRGAGASLSFFLSRPSVSPGGGPRVSKASIRRFGGPGHSSRGVAPAGVGSRRRSRWS